MNINTLKIGVLCGGFSNEREISLKGAKAINEELISKNIDSKLIDIKKIGFRSDNVILSEPKKNTLLGEIKFCEYLGSEQFVYVDCNINDQLIVIKLSPKIKVDLNKKVGLKFSSENIHFFSQDGIRIN